jgi:small subunit ribosomal protein S2
MVKLKDLFDAGIHFGHKSSFCNPKMLPYIWGKKQKIHLIDISKTAILLERAAKKIKEVAESGGTILWVGTKKSAQVAIERVCTQQIKMPYVNHRWLGGALSNHTQIKKAMTRLLYLKDILEKTETFHTKKELVVIQKQVERLEKNIGGIVGINFPPKLVVVVDAKKELSAVKEACGMKIPIVALVDTNTDPSFINYVIPGNDDSTKAVNFIINYLAEFAQEGLKAYKQKNPTVEKEVSKPVVAKFAHKKDPIISKIKPSASRSTSSSTSTTFKANLNLEKSPTSGKPVESKAKPAAFKTFSKPILVKETHKPTLKHVDIEVLKSESIKKPVDVKVIEVAPKLTSELVESKPKIDVKKPVVERKPVEVEKSTSKPVIKTIVKKTASSTVPQMLASAAKKSVKKVAKIAKKATPKKVIKKLASKKVSVAKKVAKKKIVKKATVKKNVKKIAKKVAKKKAVKKS